MIEFVNAYIFLGLPILLSLHTLLEREDSFFYQLIYAGNVLSFMMAISLGLGAGRKLFVLRSPLVIATTIYILYTLVQTYIFRSATQAMGEADQMKSIATLSLTLLPGVSLGAVSFSWDNLRISLRYLDRALFLLSGSVLVCAIGYQFGFEFGEVLELSSIPTRYFGPIGDQIGFVSALGVFLALSRARWTLSLLHLLAVILTGTRGLLPVLGLGILAYGYFLTLGNVGSRTRSALRLTGVLLLVAGVLFSPVGEIVTERITDRALLESGVSTRGGAMLLATEIVWDHPWFGVGYSGFKEQAILRGAHLAFVTFNSIYISNAQNPYLDAAVSGGFVGLAIYLLVLLIAFRGPRISIGGAPADLLASLLGLRIWIFAMIIGLQSACIVLPVSIILLFFVLASMITAATIWLTNPNNSNVVTNYYPRRGL